MLANIPWQDVFSATGQTFYMVFIASFFSIVFGLLLGLWLFNSRHDGLSPNRAVHQSLNVVVNIGRSIPYIILMIALIPLTRFVIGTTIGMNAAIVSLTVAAIPFYARIAANALSEVPQGLIEAGYAMGASRNQIAYKILLPESLPSLVHGATLTIISLIGYSAMAGAVGGGGLGELAINYGYQRFNVAVMVMTIIILVLLVQGVQWLGDALAKRPRIKTILWSSLFIWIFCIISQVWPSHLNQEQVIRVGIIAGADEQIMKVAQQTALDQYHVKLKIVTFNDYVLPNEALNNGDIDANIFQHVPYLDAQIKSRHYQLVPLAKTFIYPMGFYSHRYSSLQALPDGALIAIPNDPSNEGRALLLFEKTGLIKLRQGIGLNATEKDVVVNAHHFKFIPMDAAQIPRALSDVALGALTNDYVKPAGFTVNQALIKEGADSPYVNVIVIQAQDKNSALLQKLVDVMHSKPVIAETLKVFPNGAAMLGW